MCSHCGWDAEVGTLPCGHAVDDMDFLSGVCVACVQQEAEASVRLDGETQEAA